MIQQHKIAIIAGQLVLGGAERQLYFWLSHLDRTRFQPIVLTLHPGHDDFWEKPIESLGIQLIRIPHRSSRLARLLDIVRVLRPYQPQLIHGWHLFTSPYAGMAARLLVARSLGGVRGTSRTFWNNPLEACLTLYLVDGILVNSYSTAEQLKVVIKRKRTAIYAVQNAIEDQKFDRQVVREDLSKRFSLPQTNLWIGSLGRLDPKKRFDLLLKVISLFNEEVKEFNFLLIGDGPERLPLERLAKDLGIDDHVVFVGEVKDPLVWLSSLDIFCFTSLDEGMPNVIMEAAIAKIPIVTWRLPFITEILDQDEMAMLIEPENVIGFRESLLKLSQSEQLRIELGNAAHDHVLKKFTIDRFIQNMSDAYEDILGSR